MSNILFFCGQSLNGAITSTIQRDAQMLEARGHTVFLIELAHAPQLPDPSDLDLIIGYQCWGLDAKDTTGRSYIEEADCPFIVVLGDHPIHHAARVLGCPKNTVFCTSSRNQADFLKNILHVPGDAQPLPAAVFSESVAHGEDRDIESLFIGNVESPEAFLESQNLPPVLNEIIREYVDLAMRHPGLDPITAYMKDGFERVMKIVGNQPSALAVARLVDLTTRREFRWRYTNVLRKLPVTFVGDAWVDLPRKSDDQFTALRSLSFSELPHVYARAQLCLNLHPPYFDFHERILDAMAQETAMATPRTPWMEESFRFGGEVLALPDSPDKLPDWLASVLADPARLAEIGREGCRAANERFGRQMCVDFFLDVLKKHESEKCVPELAV